MSARSIFLSLALSLLPAAVYAAPDASPPTPTASAATSSTLTPTPSTPPAATTAAASTSATLTDFSQLSAEQKQQIDQIIDRALQNNQLIGYALAVVNKDGVLYQRTCGVADLETKQSITARSVFGLASITKTFTALEAMLLIDKGQLDPNAKVRKYLLDAPHSWDEITVGELARMTAGFPHDLQSEIPWNNGGYEEAKSMQLHFEPGTTFQYSNVSYRVLGQVIENITGKKLQQSYRTDIFEPAGMTSTDILSEVKPLGTLVTPYGADPAGNYKRVAYKAPAVNFASGNLFSDIDDMGKYASCLLNRKFLSKDGYQTYWVDRPEVASKPSRWAYGWGSFNMSGNSLSAKVAMNGGLNGVASNIIIYPNAGVAIVSLSNFRSHSVYMIANEVGKMLIAGEGESKMEESPGVHD